MRRSPWHRSRLWSLLAAAVTVLLLSGIASSQPVYAFLSGAQSGPARQSGSSHERYMVVAKSDADFDALRDEVVKAGGKVVKEMRDIKTLAVAGPSSVRDRVGSSGRAEGIARDVVRNLVRPEQKAEFFGTNKLRQRIAVNLASVKATPGGSDASTAQRNRGSQGGDARDRGSQDRGSRGRGTPRPEVNADPAFSYPGLMWNFERIEAPKAWPISLGDKAVRVGVVDTGLDPTHSQLQGQIADVVDFTADDDLQICKTLDLPSPPFPSTNMTDADMAAAFGGPANGDWNGHGTWIGGAIAAALDGQGTNGVAPHVRLVSLKVAQWCGGTYDSTILDAILYAANHGIDVINISFTGYLNLQNPDDRLTYAQYVAAVARATVKGTVVVASAGNAHVRVGAGGRVLSHGSLTAPGSSGEDLYGLYQVPGGIPGVVDVAATGNVVSAPSADCPDGTTGDDATCKPGSDAHQPFGVGKENQLSYYSNYGPRIDVAAPGGGTKFNLPTYDRGGTSGFPVTTDDGAFAWGDFGITSNWAIEVPCYLIGGGDFPENDCYTNIQGTSMAAPHASAVLALIASRNQGLRHRPLALVAQLKQGALNVRGNSTPPLNPRDRSGGDLTGGSCPDGSCHLGGEAIPDREAYGAGLVDAYRAVSPGR